MDTFTFLLELHRIAAMISTDATGHIHLPLQILVFRKNKENGTSEKVFSGKNKSLPTMNTHGKFHRSISNGLAATAMKDTQTEEQVHFSVAFNAFFACDICLTFFR